MWYGTLGESEQCALASIIYAHFKRKWYRDELSTLLPSDFFFKKCVLDPEVPTGIIIYDINDRVYKYALNRNGVIDSLIV